MIISNIRTALLTDPCNGTISNIVRSRCMNGPLEWIAALGTMVAAAMIAADLGRKVTGWGFVLFSAVSVTWIIAGMQSGATPIAAMNAILLLINVWGIWQYLLSRKNREVMERIDPIKHEIEREVERELGSSS